MLPILKRLIEKKEAGSTSGVLVKTRTPDKVDEKIDPIESIEHCGQELLFAIAARDPKAVAAAIYTAFSILEKQPHEENNTYQEQNIKAGEEY